MSRIARGAAGVGALGAAMALPAGAQAEDLEVTTLNDAGTGSLRAAIEEADLDADSDRILFRSDLSGSIDLTSDYLHIDSPMQILGPGARKLAVDATQAGRVAVTAPGAGEEVLISGLALSGNDGFTFGGTIFHSNGQLTISKSAVTGGDASSGGGIYVDSGELVLEDSTVSGNEATDFGGGIFSQGALTLRNSTISGNSAVRGGGAYLDLSSPSNAAILSSTVTANEAADLGGGLYENSNGATIRGSIIAGNTATSFADLDDGTWATSFSLIGDTEGADIENDGGNLLDVDPDLLGLANNGGPTDTHALAKSSPAINAGPSDAPGADQRGAPRKGQPDIGAYEFAKCAGVLVNVVGTEGKDKLKGTSGKDGILGLKGKDKLSGKGKKDGLCGAGGKDKLKGGGGKDKLKGGPGKDKLIGGPGKDKLVGGPGKDKEIQ